MTDPYVTPSSDPAVASDSERTRIYSPLQVSCGALFGPVAVIYFLWANFVALGNSRRARKTLVLGVFGLIALLGSAPFLPERSYAYLSGAYIAIGMQVSAKYQMTKGAIARSPVYAFHSGWRVLFLGIVCLVLAMVFIVGPLVWLSVAGILKV